MKRKRDIDYARPRKKRNLDARHQPTSSSSFTRHPTLSLYYQNVCQLGQLLNDWLPSTSRTRRKRLTHFHTDYPQHAAFLQNTLVGYNERPSVEVQTTRRNELVAFTQTQRVAHGDSHELRMCNVGEIVDFAIWTLFQKSKIVFKAPAHLLCHGYRSYSSVGQGKAPLLQLPGIVRQGHGPNAETFKTSPWSDLAYLLGIDAETIMLHLLLDCGVFEHLPTGRNNFYQLSGEPLSQTKTLPDLEPMSRPKAENGSVTEIGKKPGSISFVRNRMFHARPSLKGQGIVQLGLKHIHILNRCKHLHDDLQDVRVMQYIFPRQFGLHNVFTSKANPTETVQPLKDYTMREQEIFSFSQPKLNKIPRRLRGAIRIIQKLRTNHARCSYTQLLRHYCPCVPMQGLSATAVCTRSFDSSIDSERPVTQFVRTSTESGQESHLEENSTSSFIPYATPASHVTTFCKAVLLRLFSRDTFGTGKKGVQNWQQILRSTDRFIGMRRFESLTLHEVCQSISVECIDWLRPPKLPRKDHLSCSDSAKRIEILQELIYYVFDSVLIPLVRSNFYVTETGVHRNRVCYFRHDVWKKMAEPSLATMRLSMFEPLQARQLRHSLASNSLGCSQMRLLPKEHGTRPIVNLRRKAMTIVDGKPVLSKGINARLAPVFNVLNLERQQRPEILASAMFSVGEMHSKLKDFKARTNIGSAKYYFIKVDIRSCFDTIPQKELLEFIDSLLLKEQYQIATHVEMKPLSTMNSQKSTRVVAKYVSRAVAASDSSPFSSAVAADLATRRRRHVFVGTDQERVIRLVQVRKMLIDHIQHNIVRVGRQHFRQVEGIPQGSVLSSLLCNLFYGDFERQQLGFLDPHVSLLLRLIDDFLLITTDESQARQFVQAMSDGHVKHGISVNSEKSLVNFEVSIRGHKIPRLHGSGEVYFPYCGMMINTRDLQVRKDRQLRDLYVANGLSVAYSGKVGSIFQSKVISSLKRQLHTMLLDGSMNTREQILTSIFECYVETAMKLHQYLKSLPKRKHPTTANLICLCNQLIDIGTKILRRTESDAAVVVVTKPQMSWLAAAALIEVLVRKYCGYSSLLFWLQQVEGQARKSMNMTNWELKRMASGGIEPFSAHVY